MPGGRGSGFSLSRHTAEKIGLEPIAEADMDDPTEGDMIYDPDTDTIKFYDGASWMELAVVGGPPTGHTHGNADLTGVPGAGIDTTAIQTGDAAGGDLGGTFPNPSVTDDSHNHGNGTLTGVPGAGIDTTAIQTGDAAGGDLGGTFPNPSVTPPAASAITATGFTGNLTGDGDVQAALDTLDAATFGQGQINRYDVLAEDWLPNASYDFVASGAVAGWDVTGDVGSDAFDLNVSGELEVLVDGGDGTGVRSLEKTFTIPGPPASMGSLTVYAVIDFTGTIAGNTETEFRLRMKDSSGDVLQIEVHESSGKKIRLQRNIGSDVVMQHGSSQVIAWLTSDTMLLIQWTPMDMVGRAAIGGNSTEVVSKFHDVQRMWSGTVSTLEVSLNFKPDHADDSFTATVEQLVVSW